MSFHLTPKSYTMLDYIPVELITVLGIAFCFVLVFYAIAHQDPPLSERINHDRAEAQKAKTYQHRTTNDKPQPTHIGNHSDDINIDDDSDPDDIDIDDILYEDLDEALDDYDQYGIGRDPDELRAFGGYANPELHERKEEREFNKWLKEQK